NRIGFYVIPLRDWIGELFTVHHPEIPVNSSASDATNGESRKHTQDGPNWLLIIKKAWINP
ncbi:MAG: hypothetical protein PVG76_05790, partial [Chromatiales bacterium]